MSEVERINTAWNRIEQWFTAQVPAYTLPDGASAAAITELESKTGSTLPDGLKASFQRHNGMPLGKWTRGGLCSIEESIGEWETWAEMVDNGSIEHMYIDKEDEHIQPVWFCKSWIFIDSDNSGSGGLVDLKPGPLGRVGQVLDFDSHGGPALLFPDFAGYLENVAIELESGKYGATQDGWIQPAEYMH